MKQISLISLAFLPCVCFYETNNLSGKFLQDLNRPQPRVELESSSNSDDLKDVSTNDIEQQSFFIKK